MPRTDDHSTGDARQPYSDKGGTEARHAETHDVRREEATRPKAHEEHDDFDADLVAEHSAGGHVDESISAADDKALLDELASARTQLAKLTVAWSLVFLSLVTVMFFARLGDLYSRVWLAGFYGSGLLSLYGARFVLYRKVRRWTREGRLDRRAVIVGGGTLDENWLSAV